MAALSPQLRVAVARLAAPASEQEAYLRNLGTAPSVDELALEFSDALMVDKGSLEQAVRDIALQLDDQLSAMSGPQYENLWTLAALQSRPEWVSIRELAAEILRRDVR